MLTDIALDAVGSDKAPEPEIRGAILACRALPVRVHLIGPESELRDLLDEYLGDEDLPIIIHHASERIGMDEKAAHAVRSKRDSSIRVGLKLVREGKAAGFVTAGNTGAAMATAKMVLGALPGVDRPALATPMPTSKGNPCVLLDVGANVDCKAQNLEQFAVMGEMYARSVFKIAKPRVGLLSIGEEESKGNELTREALPLLKALPIHFIGNVEGRDIFNGHADVIVCDGFVGNVALKTSEGIGRFVRDALRSALNRTVTAQVGALLSRRAFNDFRRRLDYTEYGGAPLLGVRGVCIIGHGSSNDVAIYNGIRVAHEFSSSGAIERMAHAFSRRPGTRPDHGDSPDAIIQ
ncbi:MAG: phosphate acyltransferase PlsX [Terracidiphilus sp.]|jgi:glycerol-3-phosphate acyltransferase PlsX